MQSPPPPPLSRRLRPPRTRTLSGKTRDGLGERPNEEEFKKWRSRSCEKKVSPPHRRYISRPSVLSPSAVVGEFFLQRTNSPTFCCSGVFPSRSRTNEGESDRKRKSRYQRCWRRRCRCPLTLSFYLSIGSCYATADRRTRTWTASLSALPSSQEKGKSEKGRKTAAPRSSMLLKEYKTVAGLVGCMVLPT